MYKPKISIIVPVYKTETYIRRCLNSIVNQTFNDWECILVDDGSPDNSGIICDEYSQMDARFRVIHKSNEGVSSARQKGLSIASGDYVIHVDPDDWIETDMLEGMFLRAVNECSDMVICDLQLDFKDCSVLSVQKPEESTSEGVFKCLFTDLHGSCCNKLVKKSIIDDFSISFPKGFDVCEDLFFISLYVQYCTKISYVNRAFYHYVHIDSHESMTSVKKFDLQYYKKLYNLFIETFTDETKKLLIKTKFAYMMSLGAYLSGNMGSFSFFKEFYGARRLILLNKSIPKGIKLKLYLSSIGFYCICKAFDYLKNGKK